MLKLYEKTVPAGGQRRHGRLVGSAAAYLPYGLASAILAERVLAGKGQKIEALAGADLFGEAVAETLAAVDRGRWRQWLQ